MATTSTPDRLMFRESQFQDGVPLRTGRAFEIVVERKRADLLVRFVTNQIPPWRDSQAPEARLLDSAGKIVARQAIVREGEHFQVRFSQVPETTPLRLEVDGQPPDAAIIARQPLDAPLSASPEPAPAAAPETVSQGRVFKYHDARRARKVVEDKAGILAHARSLGGFYLLDSVGRQASNRPAFDDVQRVQERLWALGFLDVEAVGQPLQDSDEDATVRAILALQSRLGARKPDGKVSPDGASHAWLMGRGKLDPQFIFEPEEALEPRELLEPGQNPAWTDAGRYPQNADGEDVVLVAKDTPLWTMIRSFDGSKVSQRHYDIVDPLDGLTFGIAHWPLNDGFQICSAIFAEQAPREALLMRFREFFEVAGNEPLWQIFQRDVARQSIDLEVDTLDLEASLPDDIDLNALLESGLRKTLLDEAWWKKSGTQGKHAGRRVWDLLWFRKALGYALRDRRIVEFQLRFWISDLIHGAQKTCQNKLGIRTVGGMAALVSLLNSRPAWLGGLPVSGNSYAHRRWEKKRGITIDYDSASGTLEIKKQGRAVVFDWKRDPQQDWRSYVVWQYYWTMRDFWDRKPDLRDRMCQIWNTWFAKSFGRSFEGSFKSDAQHHALTSLARSAHQSSPLEAGTLLPEAFDPKDRSTWAVMQDFVPCYARLAQA